MSGPLPLDDDLSGRSFVRGESFVGGKCDLPIRLSAIGSSQLQQQIMQDWP